MSNKIEDRIGTLQFNYHYNFIPRLNTFYVEVPKTGCSSLKSFFYDALLSEAGLPQSILTKYKNEPHAGIMESPFVKPYQIGRNRFISMMNSGDYFVFTVVRDPILRLISAYKDKIRGNRPQAAGVLRYYESRGRDLNSNGRNITLNDFAKYICSIRGSRQFDSHWRPQFYQTSPDFIRYSKIIKFERLNEEMRILAGRFNLQWDCRKLNKTKSSLECKKNLVMDDEVYESVLSKYRLDYEIFYPENDAPKSFPVN